MGEAAGKPNDYGLTDAGRRVNSANGLKSGPLALLCQYSNKGMLRHPNNAGSSLQNASTEGSDGSWWVSITRQRL